MLPARARGAAITDAGAISGSAARPWAPPPGRGAGDRVGSFRIRGHIGPERKAIPSLVVVVRSHRQRRFDHVEDVSDVDAISRRSFPSTAISDTGPRICSA